MGGRWRQPSSRWVGLAVAGAYVVITAVIGTALIVAGQQIGEADAHGGRPPEAFAQYTDTTTVTRDPSTLPGRHSTTTTKPAPSTTTVRITAAPPATHKPAEPTARTDVPAGYERVTGPGGIRTVAPEGWVQARTTGPGAEIAADQDDPQRYVKYGGSATAADDIVTTHLLYEASYAARSTGYRRLELSGATFHGASALVWEFQFGGPGGTQHAKSLYWRMRGTEYFVLVSGPERDWSRMSAIYQQMVANATP